MVNNNNNSLKRRDRKKQTGNGRVANKKTLCLNPKFNIGCKKTNSIK